MPDDFWSYRIWKITNYSGNTLMSRRRLASRQRHFFLYLHFAAIRTKSPDMRVAFDNASKVSAKGMAFPLL
jgi:hypothetical protein